MGFENDEINYEDMDDLALPDHIEWNQNQVEAFSFDELDIDFGA